MRVASWHARRRWTLLAAVAVVLAGAAGCGSDVPHAEIVSAWKLRGGPAQDTSGRQSGSSDEPAGDSGSATTIASGADGPSTAGGSVSTPSDTGGSTGGTTGGSTTPGATPNGKPIRIAAIGTLGGPGGATFAPGLQTIKLWARWTNDHGGINGHPVEVNLVDDGLDPARFLAAVRDQVENKGVIAIMTFSIHDAVAKSYLEQKRVPVVGGASLYRESPMWFNSYDTGAGGPAQFWLTIADLTPARKLALVQAAELPAQSFDTADGIGGFHIVYSNRASIALPDYTQQCIDMRTAGADILFPVLDSASTQRLVRSCSRQGYHPMIVGTGGTVTNSLAKSPDFDRSAGAFQAFPWTGVSSPASDEFHAAFDRYQPNVDFSGYNTLGWAGAKMFQLAATRAIAANATPSAALVLQGLWTFKEETVGGLLAPRTFKKDQRGVRVPCSFVMQIQNGKWTAPKGLQLVCV
jgi:branched-chain amino acid transport system substrate-binding protein